MECVFCCKTFIGKCIFLQNIQWGIFFCKTLNGMCFFVAKHSLENERWVKGGECTTGTSILPAPCIRKTPRINRPIPFLFPLHACCQIHYSCNNYSTFLSQFLPKLYIDFHKDLFIFPNSWIGGGFWLRHRIRGFWRSDISEFSGFIFLMLKFKAKVSWVKIGSRYKTPSYLVTSADAI